MKNVVLEIIEFLWQQRPPSSFSNLRQVTAYDSNLWLTVDRELIATVAHQSGRDHLALCFLEENTSSPSTHHALLVQVC